jgi:hypothetical protein
MLRPLALRGASEGAVFFGICCPIGVGPGLGNSAEVAVGSI